MRQLRPCPGAGTDSGGVCGALGLGGRPTCPPLNQRGLHEAAETQCKQSKCLINKALTDQEGVSEEAL